MSVLLTGFILSSFFVAVGGLLLSLSQENWELGRAVVSFTLGGREAKGSKPCGFGHAPLCWCRLWSLDGQGTWMPCWPVKKRQRL